MQLRRCLKHADEALDILSEKGQDSSRAERLGRAAHQAGLVGYYLPPSSHHHPQLDAAAAAASDDDFEARMDARGDEQPQFRPAAADGQQKLVPSRSGGGPACTVHRTPMCSMVVHDPSSAVAGLSGDVPSARSGGEEAEDKAQVQAQAEVMAPPVGRFTRMWVGYPRLTMLLTFLTICGLSYASFLKEFKEPVNTGWTNRAHITVQRLDAWRYLPRAEWGPPSAREQGSRRRVLQTDAGSGDAGSGEAPPPPNVLVASPPPAYPEAVMERAGMEDQVTVLYAGGGSLFTEANVQRMITVERALLEHPNYTDHCTMVLPTSRCAAPQSILTYLHRNASAHEAQCREGACATPAWGMMCGVPVPSAPAWGEWPCVSTTFDWRDGELAPADEWATLLDDALAFHDAYLPAQASMRTLLSELRNASVAATDLSSRYARARFMISTHRLYNSDYTKEVVTTLEGAIGEVSHVQPGARATPEPPADGLNAFWQSWSPVGLLPAVYLDMLFALASMAFIFAYIAFNVGSLVLALAAMFEILASIPLALTVWKVGLGQDNIDFLQLVMVFLILCIGADDVFVYTDTWKASATMPPAISGSLETRFSWAWRKAAGTMFATTLTTCICLGLTALSTIPTVRSFGLFGSFLVLVDYLQVITWYPAVVIWHEKHMCCKRRRTAGVQKPKRVAAFMRDTLAPRLYTWRWPALLLSTALAGAGVAVRVTLFEPANSIPLFKPSHPWEMKASMQAEHFFTGSSDDDDKVHVGLVYGLADAVPVTYGATSQLLPDREQAGQVERTIEYDEAFSLTPAVQEALAGACEAALADAELVAAGEGFCILKDLKDHVGSDFPYADDVALRAAIDALMAQNASAANACLATSGVRCDDRTLYMERTGYVAAEEGDGIKAIYASFVTTLSRRQVQGSGIFGGDPRVVQPAMKQWDAFAASKCPGSGSGGSSGEVVCFAAIYGAGGAVGFSALLGSLSEFANQTLWICVVASFCVLVVVTLNVIVALYATLTVACVIGGVMGLIIVCGMKDGMYENVFVRAPAARRPPSPAVPSPPLARTARARLRLPCGGGFRPGGGAVCPCRRVQWP